MCSSDLMASRKGGYTSGEDLLNEVIARVEGISKGSSKQTSVSADDCRKIAVGAVKYAFLRTEVGNDILFDFEKSISFDGDTGPYIMYVYSRCNSILEKIGHVGSVENTLKNKEAYSRRGGGGDGGSWK